MARNRVSDFLNVLLVLAVGAGKCPGQTIDFRCGVHSTLLLPQIMLTLFSDRPLLERVTLNPR